MGWLAAVTTIPPTIQAVLAEKKALSLLPSDAPLRGEYEAALAKFEAALEDESK